VVDRFLIGSNFNGVTYAGEDHGYGATQFYAMRKDSTGASFFDTITASTGTTTDRFNASNRTFDALTYASDDVGYGPLQFYYLSHDNAGVSTFGTIGPGGVTGVTTDRFVVGSNFDALTYTATDLGYGANMFYYIRHDASGLSTFGTISPGLPGIVTDRFTVGTNVNALVFTDLTTPGYGPNNFYYLRHDANGLSTFGTIHVNTLTSGAVTDRFNVGTNVSQLSFTATDAGSFGPNLFYYLRGHNLSVATNTVITYTTNTVVTFTPTNNVSATGMDICQARTVSAAANCAGSLGSQSITVTPPLVPLVVAPRIASGFVILSVATQPGVLYTVQYKNSLSDPTWTDLETVIGNGAALPIIDAAAGLQANRFYRIITTAQ
jgi:hypothetical protein